MEGADLIKQGFCVSVIINGKIGVWADSEPRKLGTQYKMDDVGSNRGRSSIFARV
jgi:hypothetical protein